jgi:hypothetical protein
MTGMENKRLTPAEEAELMTLLQERILDALRTQYRRTGQTPSLRNLARIVGYAKQPTSVSRALEYLVAAGEVVRLPIEGEQHEPPYTAGDFVDLMSRKGSLVWEAWQAGELRGSRWEDALAAAADNTVPCPSPIVAIYRRALSTVAMHAAQAPKQPHTPADAAGLVCLGCGAAVTPTSPEDVAAHAARRGRCARCAGQEE